MEKLTIGIPFDLNKLIDTRLLVQAGSGGGKSYLLRKLIETVGSKVQQIVIDPEGEFVTIREKFDFALVAKEGDIPLSLKYAEMLAHKLLETNLSAIIDLYELKHHERILFVKRFLDALINAPKELWHSCLVYVDEAHIFCPESSKSESMASVIDLCTRGRKRGFAAILATQRLSKLHKDAAAECLNKMIGRTGLDIDRKRVGDELGLTNKMDMIALRDLQPGEFFTFGPAISNEVLKFKVAKVVTTHLQAGSRMASKPPTPDAVKKIVNKLANIPEEAEKELATKQQLQAEISRLRGELTRATKKLPARPVAAPDNTKVLRDEITKLKDQCLQEKRNFMGIQKSNSQLLSLFNKIKSIAQEAIDKPVIAVAGLDEKRSIGNYLPQNDKKVAENVNKIAFSGNKSPKPEINGNSTLGKCSREIIRFLASFPDRQWSKPQVGIAIGYSPNSGGFNYALSELTTAGFILRSGKLQVNQEAMSEIISAVGAIEDKEYNIETFKEKLGKCEREIYEVLLANPSQQFNKEQLAGMTESQYSGNSGGFNNSLSRLTTLELIDRERGLIRLNPELLELM